MDFQKTSLKLKIAKQDKKICKIDQMKMDGQIRDALVASLKQSKKSKNKSYNKTNKGHLHKKEMAGVRSNFQFINS